MYALGAAGEAGSAASGVRGVRGGRAAIAPDVAGLGADGQKDEIFVADALVAPVRRRINTDQRAGAGFMRSAVAELEPCSSLVHEVQLLLAVVEVERAAEALGDHERVHAELRDAELPANLAEPGALAEVVQRCHGVSLT